MNKKIIIILILMSLLINISAVSSSWYDWSRYEQDGYSFKIPEGYSVGLTGGSNNIYVLVEDNQYGYNNEILGNRIHISIFNSSKNILDEFTEDEYNNIKEIVNYNDSTTFYKIEGDRHNSTVGIYKFDNGTYIKICYYHRSGGVYNTEERSEQNIEIIRSMFESVKVDN